MARMPRLGRSVDFSHSISAWLRSPPGLALLAGALAGIYVLTISHLVFSALGTSLTACTALAVALAAGFDLGRRRRPAAVSVRHAAACQVALSLCIVALPWLTSLMSLVLGEVDLRTLADPKAFLLLAFPMLSVIAGVPAWLAARSLHALDEITPGELAAETTARRAAAGYWLLGVAVGLNVHAWLLAPLVGLHLGASLAASLAAGLMLPVALRRQPATVQSPAPQATIPASSNHSRDQRNLFIIVAALGLGALLAGLSRVAFQLLPATTELLATAWSAVVAGAACAAFLDRRKPYASDSSLLLAAAWPAVVFAAFPWLVDLLLLLNSHVSNVALADLARSLVLAAVMAPVGCGVGTLVCRTSAGRQSLPLVSLTAAGWLAAGWFGLAHWQAGQLLSVTALGLLAVVLAARRAAPAAKRPTPGNQTAAAPVRPRTGTRPGWSAIKPRAAKAAFAAGVLLTMLSPWMRSQYAPALSAKLLFATDVFSARAVDVPARFLPVLDDARLLAQVDGGDATHTLWKLRGAQIQLRVNGVPRGLVSTRPRLCPQYSAEVAQAVLPLVLHEAPQRVMVLGLSTGVPLTTCLTFPVRNVVGIEPDAGLLRVLDEHIWPASRIEPRNDQRLRIMQVEPALAVTGLGPKQDVILSSPAHSILAASSPCFTAEFYRRAAACLTQDGLFCQRFPRVDYGPEPIRVVAATLRSAFRDVQAVETAGGEMLLLATNSPKGLIRKGLVDRLQTLPVRQALATVGWDWSVPLNLTAYNTAALDKFIGDDADVNTAANARFAFALPREMMRWTPKWQEAQQQLGPLAGRWLESPIIDGGDPDLLQRLAEVTGQKKLMTGFPDQPWAYRKTLREQLLENPRTVIQPVKGEFRHRLHPEDARRKEFFESLGEAKQASELTAETIETIAGFAVPYDPLLSYFVHFEAAELYDRAGPDFAAAELAHRLHMAYFADPMDRSVRNVATALQMLAGRPELLPSAADRFDHLNALLQLLKARWEVRGTMPPKNPDVVLNDIDQTIAALEAGFEALQACGDETGVTEETCRHRREFLEKHLVRPLRTYRTRLLNHQLQQTAKAKTPAAPAAGIPALQ